MPWVTVICHCCEKPKDRPDYRVGRNKSGLEHCSRQCTNACPQLHPRTRLFTCEWHECERIYSPEYNATIGQLRSERWCSYEHKALYQEFHGRVYQERSDKGSERSEWVEFVCKGCGKEKRRRASEVREFAYCTIECYQANGGNDAPGRAKHTRTTDLTWSTRDYGVVNARVNSDGYIDLYLPAHPKARKSTRTIAAHRLVVEEAIGRVLEDSELVHHKDGQRQNNCISNLELCRYFQPPGQRIRDQVAQARKLLAEYGHLFPESESDDTWTLFDESA